MEKELNIHLTSDEFDNINRLIISLKTKYSYFFNITNNDMQSINERKVVVNNLIKDIINEYDLSIKKYEPCIFLTGSYSKSTCNMKSNIDLNYVYDSKYKLDMIKYEEIINYIISSVLNIDRKCINDSFVLNINNDICTSKVNLISDKGIISYNVNKNYDSNCDIDTMFSYLRSEVINKNKEWAHSFTPIYNKDLFMEEYKYLLRLEKRIVCLSKIKNRRNSVENLINEIESVDYINMDPLNIKIIYEKYVFDVFNEFVSLLRDKVIYKNICEWDFINYHDNKFLRITDSYWDILLYMKELYDLDFNNENISKCLKKVNRSIIKEINE